MKKWEACIWKRAYDSEADALKANEYFPEQETYLCVYCCKWHRRSALGVRDAKGAKRHFAELRAKQIRRARREVSHL
jgi:hypothetical protein